jgi:hypothetical protein
MDWRSVMHPRVRFKLCYGIFRKNLKRGRSEHIQRGLVFRKLSDGTVLISAAGNTG